jgi:hypothetical protein
MYDDVVCTPYHNKPEKPSRQFSSPLSSSSSFLFLSPFSLPMHLRILHFVSLLSLSLSLSSLLYVERDRYVEREERGFGFNLQAPTISPQTIMNASTTLISLAKSSGRCPPSLIGGGDGGSIIEGSQFESTLLHALDGASSSQGKLIFLMGGAPLLDFFFLSSFVPHTLLFAFWSGRNVDWT